MCTCCFLLDWNMQKGDAGDEFFIIERGTVVISENNSDKELIMERGKFFGEISLIRNVPRTANVVAKDATVRCLTLDRASFGRLFGEKNVATMAASNEMLLPTAATVMAPAAAGGTATAAEKAIQFENLSIDSFKLVCLMIACSVWHKVAHDALRSMFTRVRTLVMGRLGTVASPSTRRQALFAH